MPQWEAICDNFDAPVINDGHIDIHVGHAHVADDRGTSLPADASDGALKRERTCCEDAGGGASRPVIPERVKATPASAGARGKRQRQAQAAEQEDAEVGTGDITSSMWTRTLKNSDFWQQTTSCIQQCCLHSGICTRRYSLLVVPTFW